MRNLLLLMRQAIKYTDTLPIHSRSVQRSISEARNTYRNTVYVNEWQALAKIYQSKQIDNDQMHRSLLSQRCILEYCYLDAEGGIKCWYDIHPLIKGITEFQDAFKQLYPS